MISCEGGGWTTGWAADVAGGTWTGASSSKLTGIMAGGATFAARNKVADVAGACADVARAAAAAAAVTERGMSLPGWPVGGAAAATLSCSDWTVRSGWLRPDWLGMESVLTVDMLLLLLALLAWDGERVVGTVGVNVRNIEQELLIVG